ncbi:MAG: hypothetical protein ACFFDH_10025 [Promethearchaeota archaeon]
MAKYEYKVFRANNDKEIKGIWKNSASLEAFYNDMGSKGWKLKNERDMGAGWTITFERKVQ